MADTIAWCRILEDIAYLLGDELPGTSAREPAGTRTVAEALGVNRSTLLRWLDGSEPRHCDGELVLALWCRLGGKDRQYAPRERRSMSAAQLR